MIAGLSLCKLNVRRFASAFTSRLSSAVLSFVVVLVASRLLPTREYGLYVFLFSLGSALGLLFVLGQSILVVKRYRFGAPAGDPNNRALLRVNFIWLMSGVGVLTAAAVVFFFCAPLMPSPYDHLDLACLFAAIFAISEYLQNYFRIHGHINISLMPREIVWRVASAVGIGALALGGGLTGGAAAFALTTALLGATTAYQVVRFVRDEGVEWLHRRYVLSAADRAPWRRETLYFSANGILNSSSAYLETIVIGAALGLDQAGFYYVALRIAMFLTLPVAAIDTVGIPMIAARFQSSDIPGAQRLIGMLSFGSFAISLAGALALALVGGHVLTFINPEFAQHHDVLTVLCLSAVSIAFFGPGSWLLMIGGGERFFLIGRTVIFVLYLGLLYGLARMEGLIGIAIAGVAINVATNLLATGWVMRRWRIDNMATAFLKPFLLFDTRTSEARKSASGERGNDRMPIARGKSHASV